MFFEKKGRIDNQGDPWLAQVYMVGNETIPTSFEFENNEKKDVKMTLYAPNSTFNVWNQGTLVGAVAAKQVTMDNNSEIRAAAMNALLQMDAESALPISYVTAGREMPDDIHPASAAELARRVLRRERP